MDVSASQGPLRVFEQVEDPRVDRTKAHSLYNILVITLCAVLCGADTWTDVALFGRTKRAWLETFLNLPNGIPSHDTFGRVFSRLDPQQLEACFMAFTSRLAEAIGGNVMAIDGKTLRRSFDKAGKKSAIHMVSAWCESNRMVLGQLATDAKSNEITAIPKLLAMLDVTDTVVTIDAMGCQKKIAKQIVDQEGHYVLQVKSNQPALHDTVAETMDDLIKGDIPHVSLAYHEAVDGDHGRVERRQIWTTEWIDWYSGKSDWPGLKTFICVERERQIGEDTSRERSYYISDLVGVPPERMLGYIRGHWGIENRLHWCLDVAFREDESRQRIGHSAENASRIRRLALNLLRNEKTCKNGVKAKRLKAALDQDYLLKVICGEI